MGAEPVDLRTIAPDVGEYLMASLPREEEGAWEHMCSTAYQIGCMALAKLGFAEETDWGALRRAEPVLPDVMPRWDDVCIAVLRLADQQGRLSYLRPDGMVRVHRAGRFIITPAVLQPPPVPNISPAHGLGPALADGETLSVLASLGLVQGGAWTAAAETVLWRCHPGEWEMTVETDHRFTRAVGRAVASVPQDVRAEIARLATVTEGELQDEVADLERRRETLAQQRPGMSGPAPDLMAAARRLVALRRNPNLDWLFFCRWRLEDGWLSDADTSRALEIFHDPLAIAMRRAVLCRLYPDSPVAQA